MAKEKKPCLVCGNDCSFLAFCEGICISCADGMQQMDRVPLIMALGRALTRAAEKVQPADSDKRRTELRVTVTHPASISSDDVQGWANRLIGIGMADAADSAKDDNLSEDARKEANDVLECDFGRFELIPR